MAAPEPDDPQDAVVARQYTDHHSMFQKTARHWAAAFAGAKHKFAEFESALKGAGIQCFLGCLGHPVVINSLLLCCILLISESSAEIFHKINE